MKEIKWYTIIGFIAVIFLTTMFLRIPLLSAGYFNLGDVAVVFTGLMLGKKGGALAGGLGSALADIMGGFAIFAPLTLVAKGLEGFFCGFAKNKSGYMFHLFPAIGCFLMVVAYFVGEIFMPQIKFAGATAELLPNIIQAIGGYIGGKLLFAIYNRIQN